MSQTHQIAIEGMTCASCVGRVERTLKKIPGVEHVAVNLATEMAHVIAQDSISYETLAQGVTKAGYVPHPPELTTDKAKRQAAADHREKLWLYLGIALTLPLVLPMFAVPFGQDWMPSGPWQLVLATPVQFIVGWRFYSGAFKALRAKSGNMDVLVALGTSAAYGLSLYQLTLEHGHHLYFEAAASVITLVRLGKWMEGRAKHATVAAIEALAQLRPETVTLEIDGSVSTLPLAFVKPGHVVHVKPGERFPVDGVIVEGATQVDNSHLSGESLSLSRTVKDTVNAGAVNGEGFVRIQTTAIGHDTLLGQIISHVENAQAAKAPIQAIVDQVSEVFVPVIMVVAAITLLAWGLGWFGVSSDWNAGLINAVTVLVIACPCALGLATPTAIMVGTGVAAQHGILIKDALALELAHKLVGVAFDKTGTLTVGHPTVTGVQHRLNSDDAFFEIAAALQAGSEHPLAKATLQRLSSPVVVRAEDVTALPGFGVQGRWQGQTYQLTNLAWLSREQVDVQVPDEFTSQGWTVSVLSQNPVDGAPAGPPEVLGLIAFGDDIKPTAAAAIQELHRLGVKTLLISGDNMASASKVAKALDIGDFKAQVLPHEKSEILNQWRTSLGGPVGMVGDGMNDAPALAAADVGIAMSTGTDVAMHTAGVTLMRGDPALVAAAIDISKHTYAKIRQNLFWALVYNVIGVPLAAFGVLNPVFAGAAMALSSVSVVSNALLLKRWRPVR